MRSSSRFDVMTKSWTIFVLICLLIATTCSVWGAIAPPPWSDPARNPCAALPGGWQLLFWAPLNKCFKIFQVGFPCPDTMELSPSGNNMLTSGVSAECKCPPGTAQFTKSSPCYTLFTNGPCEEGKFFAPISDSGGQKTLARKRWGTCKAQKPCQGGMLYWPKDGKCYTLHTKGPCPKGKLITLTENKLAECRCHNSDDLAQYFYAGDNTCHEHFTPGPCNERGNLFLPGGLCGCNSKLPHFDENTQQCFELGTIGPCTNGRVFMVSDKNEGRTAKASCQCKEDYAEWSDGYCYRQYTQGPCENSEFLVNSTCITNPCGKGRLYFPEEQTCYRIGTQGPCSSNKVVVFDFTTRPSVDGVSYNGVCGCAGILSNLDQSCNNNEQLESACEATTGMVEMNGKCFKLYSRGPCGPGQWLEPLKIASSARRHHAKCQCRPGFTEYEADDGYFGCHAPSVGLARYLNSKSYQNYTFAFRRVVR